jgi:hypothetical protein
MDPGEVLMLATVCFAGVAIVRTIANTILRLREQKPGGIESQISAVSDERIARIEAAVESIAIEVERISEGQRFTTRLLSDQSKPVQAFISKPGKFDTPH